MDGDLPIFSGYQETLDSHLDYREPATEKSSRELSDINHGSKRISRFYLGKKHFWLDELCQYVGGRSSALFLAVGDYGQGSILYIDHTRSQPSITL